jgi:hypothetical protein
MALLAWARPRRWSILGEAVLAAAVALAAWPILAFENGEPEPVALVRDYLQALRDGDVDRAESLISGEPAVEVDRSWLTAEAMSSDWEIESVELKSASETTVHVVISSGETRAEGAFHIEDVDDDLRISNPYRYLSVTSPLFSSIEVNGVRGEVAAADGAPVSVALYPGFYSLFASVPELSGEDGVSFLAVPDSYADPYNLDSIDLNALMTEPLTSSDAFETRINEDLAAWLDDCAASDDVTPADCPFSAAYLGISVYDGRNDFASVSELDWAVATYPRIRFNRDLRLELVEPGWITLTGRGIALGDDAETDLNGRCGVELENIIPVIGEDGDLAFTMAAAHDNNTCV